jgi:hypothetical protein
MINMNQKTLEALQGSIMKWKDIENGTGIDDGASNCPLCLMFRADNCNNCPINNTTNNESCGNKEYHEWANHMRTYHKVSSCGTWKVFCNECKELAHKEVEFLKSLLPKEK